MLAPRSNLLRVLCLPSCSAASAVPVAVRSLLAALPLLHSLALPGTEWEAGAGSESHQSLCVLDLSGSRDHGVDFVAYSLLRWLPSLRRLAIPVPRSVISLTDSSTSIVPKNSADFQSEHAVATLMPVLACISSCNPALEELYLGLGFPIMPFGTALESGRGSNYPGAALRLFVEPAVSLLLAPAAKDLSPHAQVIAPPELLSNGTPISSLESLEWRIRHSPVLLDPYSACLWNACMPIVRPLVIPFVLEARLGESRCRSLLRRGALPSLPLFPLDPAQCASGLECLPAAWLQSLQRQLDCVGLPAQELAQLLCGCSAIALAVACRNWPILLLCLQYSSLGLQLEQLLEGCRLRLRHAPSDSAAVFLSDMFQFLLEQRDAIGSDLLRLALLVSESTEVASDPALLAASRTTLKLLFQAGILPENGCSETNCSRSQCRPHIFLTRRIELWRLLMRFGAKLSVYESQLSKRTLLHVKLLEKDVAAVYFILNHHGTLHPSFEPVTVLLDSLSPHSPDDSDKAAQILSIFMQEGIRPKQKVELESVLALKSLPMFEVLFRQDWLLMPHQVQLSRLEENQQIDAQLLVLIASCFNISDSFMLTLWSSLGLSRGYTAAPQGAPTQSLHSSFLLAPGSSILHAAAAICFRKPVFRFLVRQCGLSLRKRNSRQESPFLVACKASNMEAIKSLVYYSSKAAPHLAKGSTPSEDRRPEERKAELFAERDQEGNSALHLAVLSLSYSIVEFLCTEGFPIDCLNSAGQTPLDLCVAAATAADEALWETNTGMYNLLAAHYKLQKGELPVAHQAVTDSKCALS